MKGAGRPARTSRSWPASPDDCLSCRVAHLYLRAQPLVNDHAAFERCSSEALTRRAYIGLSFKVHPNFHAYRDDPRFTALLRRMGLEE